MKNGKKVLAVILAAVLIMPLFACGQGSVENDRPETTTDSPEKPKEDIIPQESEQPDKCLSDKVIILYTNDVHGHCEHNESQVGYSGYASAKKNLEDRGAYVLMMDAGDAAQGTPLVNLDSGTNAITFMNMSGYDAACPGNHEFDWGVDNAMELADAAEFDYVCANIIRKTDKLSVYKENTLFDVPGGLRIGVFGLDTPETVTKSNPNDNIGLEFLGQEALYECAQNQVNILRDSGADLIVCLGHLGDSDESVGNRSTDVLENVEGIDLFIDGHSHTRIEGSIVTGNTPRVSTGCYGKALGYAVYSKEKNEDGDLYLQLEKTGLYDAGGDIVSIISNGMPVMTDSVLEAHIESAAEIINEKLSQVFAKTEVDLNGESAPGNRTEETNMGDFCCDAILWQAREYTGGKISAALLNGGSIRQSIAAGDITMMDLKSVFPFGNTVVYLTLPGSALIEAMEAATFSSPDAIGGFPQVAGIEYTLDTTKPWTPGEQYPDSTYYKPQNPGTRISIQTIGGEKFDPDAMYTIATNNFIASGGDQWYAFRYSYRTAGFDTGITIEDALINYTNSVLDGTVGQEYALPQGRITIIK